MNKFVCMSMLLCLMMVVLSYGQGVFPPRNIGAPIRDTQDQFSRDLEFAPQERAFGVTADFAELSNSIDVLLKWNLKMCSTCDSLKYFAIKYGANSVSTLNYVTVSASCSGTINLLPPSGPSGRPGNNQMFISTQLQDETWLLQPRNCPGRYIKATSTSTLAVVAGISSNARFWIQYHDNHVHLQSGVNSNYWSGGAPVTIGVGASMYMVEYWPARPWP